MFPTHSRWSNCTEDTLASMRNKVCGRIQEELVPGRASHGGGSIHWQRDSAGAVGDCEGCCRFHGVGIGTVGDSSSKGAKCSQRGDDSSRVGY